MQKKLVKRSQFIRLTVAVGAPVTQLIQGDEVYMTVTAPETGTNAGNVLVQRQIERELERIYPDTPKDELYLTIGADGARYPISWRPNSFDESGEEGTIGLIKNVLCGFSDNVLFLIADGKHGGVNVLIETVHYETRK